MEPIFLLSCTLLITTFLITIKYYRKPRKPTHPPPPGPWKLPVIGNLHQMMTNGGRDHPHRRLAELARRHGRHVIHLQLGQLSHIVISTAEAARQVMKTHDLDFASRPPLFAPYVLYGGGYNDVAWAPYGEHWRQLRKICTLELLSARRVQSFRRIREQEVANLVKLLDALSNGKDEVIVDLSKMVGELLGPVISRAAFGTIGGANQAFMAVVGDISDAIAGFRISDLYPSLTFLPALTGFEAELKKMHREADSILDAVIDERKRQRSSNNGDGEDYLVDVLLNLQSGQLGFPLTMKVIKAVILEMLIGGMDTTSKVIEWTMSEMIKHPKIMQKAQQEVRQAFEEKGSVDEASLRDHHHQLKYLECVIKESLRLHPPAAFLLPRENRERVELCGYEIPEKTRVFVNVWAISRDPRYWSEPEKFYPERLVDCSTDYKGNDFQFIPFGAGRRMCPGYGFAMEVVKLTLANLIFHFRWKLPGGESLDMTESNRAIVGRKYALRVIPVPYHDDEKP